MTDLRKVTQEDINQMVSSEVAIHAQCDGPINWDLIALDVYNIVARMRRRDIVDEVYGLEEMIETAIEEYI